MKTILIAAAALGLSTAFAAADCPGHANKQVLASSADKEITTASTADNNPTTADAPVTVQNEELVLNEEEAKAE